MIRVDNMYIMNSDKTILVNAMFVERFRITEKSDAVLISACKNSTDPAITLGRYANLKEAREVFEDLYAALANNRSFFDMPDSILYAMERKKYDARTKRKGGS